MGYRIVNGLQYPVGNFPIENEKSKRTPETLKDSNKVNFSDLLKEKLNKPVGFTISKHAAERMESCNMNPSDFKKINEAINLATEKGVKNCLIVYREVAMITSVENRTVITAVDKIRAKDNVFTNIDSVILL